MGEQGITAEMYKAIIAVVDERVKEIKVTREDFDSLRSVVQQLAEAQRRTEQRVEELAQAQKRTEQRLEELAQAQKRTEERLTRLEMAVAELAEAQKRTEQRVEELAQAQKRTEQELASLAKTVKDLQKEVGGMSDTIGYTLENAAYKALPLLLREEYSIELENKPVRTYLKNSMGKEEEVNVYGLGKRGKEKVIVIGESKSRLSRNHVDKFLRKLNRLKPSIPEGEKFLVMITHQSKPDVVEYAKENGIRVYFSYDFD